MPRVREEWIREIRGERLQGIAEGTSIALRLAHQLHCSSGETGVRGPIVT